MIRDLTLKVNDGDFFGIVGPNGSGKTTLLRIVSGTLHTPRGKVFIDGKDMGSMRRREISKIMGVLPQERVMGFDFRVEEIVSMGRYPHMSRLEFNDESHWKVVERSMEYTGVKRFRDEKFSRLSGGEKQRVYIARALAQEPKILLLDEPTKDLDIKHAIDIMKLIEKKNREEDLTVISVLHDLNTTARFCTKMAVLRSGRLYSSGESRKIITSDMVRQVFGVEAKVREGDPIRVDTLM